MLPFFLFLLSLSSSLLCSLSSAQQVTVSAYSATIYSIYPSTVGTTGGTSLTVTGVGFMRGEGTTVTTDGATIVYVDNLVCSPIDYYTTDNLIVCILPPSPIPATGAGIAAVQMVLTGTGWGTFATCADTTTNCRLTYSTANTPVMYDAPLAGTTGSILQLQGALYAQYIDQLSLRIGSYICSLDWQLTTTATPWYTEPLTNGNNGQYAIQCRIEEQVAGKYNLSLLVSPPDATVATATPTNGYGYAVLPRFSYRVDDNGGLPYTFIQTPSVTAVQPSTGATTGGGQVTITGTSFGSDCSVVSVTIAGAVATPLSCSMTQLIVQPAAQTDYRTRNATAFTSESVGQNGLTHQLLGAWNGVVQSSSTQYGGFNNSFNVGGFHRMFGYMVAPYTATYSFLINGNGFGEVWLSNSSTDYTTLTVGAGSLNYTARNDLWLTAGQQSAAWTLTAGQPIFINALYYSTQFALGVRIHNPSLSAVDTTTPFLATDTRYNAMHTSVPTVHQLAFNAGSVREVQQIYLSGISNGTLIVYVDSASSNPLLIDASASTWTNAINSVQPCMSNGYVSVTKGYAVAGQPYFGLYINVTYNCPMTGPRELLQVANIALNESAPFPNATAVTASISSKQLVAPSTPLSGSFRVNFGDNSTAYAYDKEMGQGNWTPLMAATASAQQLHDALVVLTGINDVVVYATGNGYDSVLYQIAYYDPQGAVPCLNVDASELHGVVGSTNCSVVREGDYDRLYTVIPGEWLYQEGDQNQVTLEVNGISSVCLAAADPAGGALSGCEYLYDDTLTPTLTSVAPTTAPSINESLGTDGLTAGTVLTVEGSGFTDSNDTLVQFLPQFSVNPGTAYQPCQQATVTATLIICILPPLSAGAYTVQVQVLSKGVNAPVSSNVSTITLALQVDSVWPSFSSTAGGQLLFVSGAGFHRALNLSFVGNDSFVEASGYSMAGADVVTVGGNVCVLEAMSYARIVCRVPASSSDADSTADIVVAGISMGSLQYQSASTPQVTSIYPTQVSSAVTTLITITGSGFAIDSAVAAQQDALEPFNPFNYAYENHYNVYDDTLFTPFAVHFNDRSCNIQSVTPTQLVCLLIRAAPANDHTNDTLVTPTVYVQGSGYAATNQSIQLGFVIESIVPTYGSLAGGQYVTISGAGFVNTSTTNVQIVVLINVTLDNYPSMTDGQPLGASGNGTFAEWTWWPLTVQCDVVSVSYTQLVCFTEPTGLSAANFSGFAGIVGRVYVAINSFDSVCSTLDESQSCYYGFAPAATPLLTSLAPASGGVGTTLTISGSSFGGHSISIVLIGHDSCPIVSSTDTQIVCTVPAHTAYNAPVQVLFSDVGYGEGSLVFEQLLFIDHISVTSGSYAGGTYSTLYGNGFSPVLTDNVLLVGSEAAIIVDASYSQLTFLTPASASAASATQHTASMVLNVTGYYYKNYNYPDLTVYSAYPILGNTNPPIVTKSSTTLTGNTLGQQPTTATPATFTYDNTLTPTLTAVSPTSGADGTLLTLTGSGFGEDEGNSSVWIGNLPCTVSNWSATSIVCAVGQVPAGTYPVDVYISNEGLAYVASKAAANTTAFTAALSVTATSSLTGGYGGGTLLTITGTGFSTNASANELSICNTRCTVSSASYTQLTCLTDTLATLDRIRALGPTSIITAMATPIGNMGASITAAQLALAFDMDEQTTVTSTISGTCWLGMDMGAGNALAVTQFRWFAPYTHASTANGGTFQVSNDMVNWATLATISNAMEAWNSATIVDTSQATVNVTTAYRYVRYYAPPGGKCAMAELQFIGYMLSSVTTSLPATGFSDTASCPVSLTIEQPDQLFSPQLYSVAASSPALALSDFVYSLSATPLVTDITPNQGSSLGGTAVTISGSGFTDAAHTTVAFSSYPCIVSSVSSTSIVCTTTERSFIGPSPTGRQVLVTVNNGTVGNAILAADTTLNTSPLVQVPILPYFRYLDRWSQLNTWANNEPPVYNDTVIIPEGQTILMDMSPPLIFVLLVQGVLVWDRQDGLTLDAYYIWINGGTFQIGTQDQPFMQTAVVTLHGDRQYTIELPHIGSKVLNVGGRGEGAMGTGNYLPYSRYGSDSNPSVSDNYDNMDGQGVLDIHGIPRLRVWTKVAQDAVAGSSTIVAAEQVDYQPGETIFITASSGDMWETEVLTVASLAADNVTITVTTPLQFEHKSFIYTVAGETIDMRVEVALLSRNIRVQGDELSDEQQYGAHTMMTPGGIMRIENAEFTRCGQGFNLGRYCIHWHLAGDASDSYAKSNSIHRSYQRATTVHGTELVTVFNEVAYDVKGHTFFIEDGAERENTWSQNLGVLTQPLYTMLDGDRKPATFWTSSPTNAWVNNVAAGSSHDGYWFQLPSNPGGPSYTPTICPVNAALGQFYNNTAKNCGVHGLRIYPQYTPMMDPCNGNSAPLDVYFYNFTAYKNGGNGIFGKVNGAIHHVNTKLSDNSQGELSWVRYESVVYGWLPSIQNLLAVGTHDSSAVASLPWKIGVWLSQNEYHYIQGATFVNYGSSPALSGCNDCDSAESYKQGGYTYRIEGLQFINSAVRTFWSDPPKEIFFDLDGSLTGYVNGTATPYYPWNEWPECVKQGATYTNGLVCNGDVRVRRLQMENVAPNQLNWLNLAITGLGSTTNSTATLAFRPKEIYGWAFPIVTGKQTNVQFASQIDWTQMFLRYSEPEYVRDLTTVDPLDEWAWLKFNFINYRYSYSVLYPGNVWNMYDTTDSWYVPYLNTSLPSSDYGGGYPTYMSPIGTGALTFYNSSSQVGGGYYDLIVNTVNTTEKFTNKYQLWLEANQCPPQGCPAVLLPGQFGPPVLWSQASSWVGITADGQVPAAGDTVTIPPTVYMIVDPATVQVDQLTVQGKLEFLDDGTDRELIATRIAVSGLLVAGNSTHPYQSRLTITLQGNPLSPTLIVVNRQFLGNKVLAVYGNLSMHGTPRAYVNTRLSATVLPGATTLTVTDPVDWLAGNDTIVVSSTEYDITQSETFNITAISYSADKQTATLTVNTPFRYRHFGGDIAHGSPYVGGGKTRLAAVVALTNRNIVIRGDMLADSSPMGYGASIVVSEVPSVLTPAVGNFNVSFVEFRDVGKLNFSNPAILFSYYGPGNPYPAGGYYYQTHTVTGSQQTVASSSINAMRACSLSRTWNQGIVATGAQGVYLDSNLINNAYDTAISFDAYSTSAVITNNQVVGAFRSLTDLPIWVMPIAAYFILTVPLAFTGNVATGGADAGFTMRMAPCGGNSSVIYGNEAHANLIGLYALPDMTGGDCVQVSGWTLWKNAHHGLLSVDQTSNVEVSQTIVSDNHIGISLNFVRGAVDEHIYISQSVIMGSTAASTCQASLTCLAVSPTDLLATSGTCGSVMGPSYRRVGLLTPSLGMNAAHTCEIDPDGMLVCTPPNRPTRLCGMPWENRYGLPTTSFSLFNVSTTTFAYWNASDCGLTSAAVAWNPTQTDHTPVMNFRTTTWTSADVNSRFSLESTDVSNGCGSYCDGRDQTAIRDEDGTTLDIVMAPGSPGHTLVSNNPPAVGGPQQCEYISSWNAYACHDTVFRRMIFESEDIDRGTRRIGPVLINRQTSTNYSYFSIGPMDDECPERFHFSWFPFLVQPGYAHDIESTGTTPQYVRLTYLSQDPTEKLVVSIFYEQPMQLELFMGDAQMTALSRHPTIDDPIGSWVFDPQARRAYLVVGGVPNGIQYNLVTTALVQVTMTLAVDYSTFDGPSVVEYLALLGPSTPSRIVVASVHSGSTVATYNIMDANSTTADPTELQAQQQRMFALSELLIEKVLNSSVGGVTTIAGYPVVSLVVTPPAVNGSTSTPAITVVAPPSQSSSGLSHGALAGIIVGSLAVAILVLLLAWCCVRARRSKYDATSERTIVARFQPVPLKQADYTPKQSISFFGKAGPDVEMGNIKTITVTPRQGPALPTFSPIVPEIRNSRPPERRAEVNPFPVSAATVLVPPPALPATPPRMERYDGETDDGAAEGQERPSFGPTSQAVLAVRPGSPRAVLPPPIVKVLPAPANAPAHYGDEVSHASDTSDSNVIYEGEQTTGMGMYTFYNQHANAGEPHPDQSPSSATSSPAPPVLPALPPRTSLPPSLPSTPPNGVATPPRLPSRPPSNGPLPISSHRGSLGLAAPPLPGVRPFRS